MAAYQQAGDFRAVNVNGNVQKNGGNVATCFCTADGRVIHAVGGPATAEKLLQEARWAVDTYEFAANKASRNPAVQALLVRQRHLAELGVFGNSSANDLRKSHGWSSGSTETRAHQLMAKLPLANYLAVRKPIFEHLTGEDYADDRSLVYLANTGIQLAREKKAPIIFVLYEGHGHSRDHYDPATRWLLSKTFRQHPVTAALHSYVVIAIPTRQLPALTQLAELPEFELPAYYSPAVVLTDCDGHQLVSIDHYATQQQLAEILWATQGQCALQAARDYAAQGQPADGMRLLHKYRRAPLDPVLRGEINNQISAMRGQYKGL